MVRVKKTGLIIAAGLLSGCLAMTSPGAGKTDESASSFSSRFGFSQSEKEEDPEADAANGPGAAAYADQSKMEEGEGPGIEDVTMSERFHADFGLYELSIRDKYFLYSNVSNGGVTDQPVYLEIPAGVDYTAEKDGVPFSYASRQTVSGRGTYVIRLTVVEDKNVPLSEQKEYRTVFRFRIDEKTPEAAAQAGGEAGLPEGMGLLPDVIPSGTRETAGSQTGEASEPERPEETEETPAPEKIPETAKAAETGASLHGDDGEPEQTAAAGEQAGAVKRSQEYLPDQSMYQVTLENGFTFLSNIPEGMAVTQAVEIRSGEEYGLFLGEEELEWEASRQLRAFGQYRLVSGDYEFDFEIINSYVNRDSYTAPVGLRITKATFNGEGLDVGNGSALAMTTDGSYELELEGQAGESFSLKLERDTQPPEVTVEVGRQSAAITYLANDINTITLSKNGKEPYEFTSAEVTGPGKYVLTVTDRAGNVTVNEFTLRYHMNIYALTAILLCVAGIAAAVVMLVRKKENLTVR